MSVFDKLKAYSRKPAAVILATVMATSTIPTTPIAQAVTAAYAESSTQTTKETKATEKAVAPADLGIKPVNWGGKSDVTLTFSTHIDNGEAVATISANQVKALVKDQLENSEDFKNQFVYTKNGQDALSKQIDAKLAEINKTGKGLPESTTDEDGNKTTYSDAVFNSEVAITPEVTGCKVELVNSTDGANSAAKVNDDGSITIKTDKEIKEGTVGLKVTQLSVKASFGYAYMKKVSNTAASGSEGSDGNDNGRISIDVGTVGGSGDVHLEGDGQMSGSSTQITDDPKAKTDVTLENVTSGYGVGMPVSTAKVTANEYYAGIDPSTFAEVDATDLYYKTTHAPYVISLGYKGLRGDIKNSNKEFDAELSDGDGDVKQNLTIKPNKHFDGGDFTINWYYPNGDPVDGATTTVHVKIAKRTIDLGHVTPSPVDDLAVTADALPFRMANDKQQSAALKKSLNEAVAKLVKNYQMDNPEFEADDISDFFDSAEILDNDATNELYYGSAEQQNFKLGSENLKLTSRKVKSDDDVLSNYTFTGSPIIEVKKMDSAVWSKTSGDRSLASKLTISGKGLNNEEFHFDKPDARWIHEKGTYTWKDGTIALANDPISSDTKFAASYQDADKLETMSEGSVDRRFYVKDSDGVIHKITDTTYKLDHTAPVLTAFNASPHGSEKTIKQNKLSVWAAEQMDVDFLTSEGPETGTASGMNNAQITYEEEGSTGEKRISPKKLSHKDGTNAYGFSINANSKVAVKSISLDLTDNAGNVSPEPQKYNSPSVKDCNVKEIEELMADTTAPTISTSWDTSAASNGKYYNSNRTLTITINAPFFNYVQQMMPEYAVATITKNGSDWETVKPGNFTRIEGTDTWVKTVTFTEDGDYEVKNVNVQDVVGRGADADGDTFTIDKTAPKLNVSWNTEAAQNGKYYNAARTATITVEEHNFDPNLFKIEAPVSAGNGDEATPAQIGGWSSNGDTHTATVTFPGQGVYTLSVSGEDLASNKSESYTSPEFVIDTIKPKIDIQNVVNRTAYAGEVAPTAAVHDTNLADGTSIEVSKISYPLSKDDPNPYAGAAINTSATDKSVSYLNPAKTKGNDGVYTLTVQAIDLAGNTESEAVTWSVNRFGSTYVISDNTGKMLDQYLKSSKTTDVKVTEINPSGLDDNKTSVELTRDTKNTTLKSGDNYTTDANTASGWSEYNYTVSKSNYDKDGAYRVLFHSEDAAGNSSENTMEGKNAKKSGAAAEINFAVDDTAPIASFVDLASNGKYEESSHKAKVSFEDNLKLSKAQIKVNGKTVATFTADQLEKNPIREFVLDGSSSKQDVSVVAWDAAGNKSKELKATGVLVTNDSFVLWMNNLPLMVGTIVAIVVVAGGIYMVVAKKRKENEEK